MIISLLKSRLIFKKIEGNPLELNIHYSTAWASSMTSWKSCRHKLFSDIRQEYSCITTPTYDLIKGIDMWDFLLNFTEIIKRLTAYSSCFVAITVSNVYMSVTGAMRGNSWQWQKSISLLMIVRACSRSLHYTQHHNLHEDMNVNIGHHSKCMTLWSARINTCLKWCYHFRANFNPLGIFGFWFWFGIVFGFWFWYGFGLRGFWIKCHVMHNLWGTSHVHSTCTSQELLMLLVPANLSVVDRMRAAGSLSVHSSYDMEIWLPRSLRCHIPFDKLSSIFVIPRMDRNSWQRVVHCSRRVHMCRIVSPLHSVAPAESCQDDTAQSFSE